MNQIETIEGLCDIVEKQNRIIREQAEILEQMGAICMEEEIEEVNELVEYYLGNLED